MQSAASGLTSAQAGRGRGSVFRRSCPLPGLVTRDCIIRVSMQYALPLADFEEQNLLHKVCAERMVPGNLGSRDM